MLPRLDDRTCTREPGPYRAFTREILRRKSEDNDIAKLKMLKEFLEYDPIDQRRHDILPLSVPKLSLENRIAKSILPKEKENETARYYRHRKSSTAA